MPTRQRQKEQPSRSDQTRQRIIEAALHAFSRHGYNKATTRLIAETAGVNEVTLFRHFGNKQNLLAAVIDHYSSLSNSMMASLEEQLSGDYRQDLMRIVQYALDILNRGREIIQLIVSEAYRQPKLREMAIQVSRQGSQVLERYLRQQMERGLIRQLDAKVAAQVFFGVLFMYIVARQIIGEPGTHMITPQVLAAQCVDIFIQGTIKTEHHKDQTDHIEKYYEETSGVV